MKGVPAAAVSVPLLDNALKERTLSLDGVPDALNYYEMLKEALAQVFGHGAFAMVHLHKMNVAYVTFFFQRDFETFRDTFYGSDEYSIYLDHPDPNAKRSYKIRVAFGDDELLTNYDFARRCIFGNERQLGQEFSEVYPKLFEAEKKKMKESVMTTMRAIEARELSFQLPHVAPGIDAANLHAYLKEILQTDAFEFYLHTRLGLCCITMHTQEGYNMIRARSDNGNAPVAFDFFTTFRGYFTHSIGKHLVRQ